MKEVTELLNSNWFVGIMTGIISGIVVYFITSYIIENRNKIEKKKRIAIANDAVLTSLRPHIANSGLPSLSQLEAIISSIARQYEVNTEDMNSPKMFCEDLVVEFVGNVYIPTGLKQESIEKLLDFIELANMNSANGTASTHKANSTTKIEKASFVAGLLSTTISLVSGIIANWIEEGNFNLIAALISISALALSFIAYIVTIKKARRDDHLIKTLSSLKMHDLRLQNHGTSFHTLYDREFPFVDYFDGGE